MKKILYFLILIMSITLYGCWGYTDIHDLNILYGVGFDLNKENNYVIVTESIYPIENKDGVNKASPINYYLATGKSIFDAARNLTKTSSGKRSFYQTCQVITLGKNLCENNLTPVIDFFTRDPKRRATNYPVIFDGYVPEIFLKNSESSEPLSAQLISIIKLYKYTGYAVNMNLAQTVSRSKNIAGTVLLNKFKLTPSNKVKNAYEPTLDGTGVFYRNKLMGYFSTQETMVANIISKQIKNTVLVINKDKDNSLYPNTTVELSSFKIKFIPIIENDKYTMNVDIKTKGAIVEYCEDQSLKNYDYKELENLVSKSLTDLITNTYLKSQKEFKVDALGFGKYFSQKNKSVSKMKPEEWTDIFCNKFNLKLNIKINIITTGSTIEKSD